MAVPEIIVAITAVGVIAALTCYFFGIRRSHSAQPVDGIQRVEVRVLGGHQPETIRVRQGAAAELVFDRQESGDCTGEQP
ncbi:hypothetical protein [Glycomyces rhizosphaerae]|uniref:Uncharacterized protein n=1 Tax=Glycomyces rhizosphaerae TaxID=2054422 RepID=A0ABV7Q831_9ACTN